MTDILHVHDTTTIDQFGYSYDPLARVSTFSATADGTATYGYDPTDQVTSATYSGGTNTPANESYSFDKNGNRTTVNGTATTVSAGNEVTNDGTNSYTFDKEGNRTSETNLSTHDTTSFTWDARNRLVEVETFNSSNSLTEAVAYVYDMFDRMIEREVDTNGATSGGNPVFNLVQNFVYDGTDPVLEFVAGSLAKRYLNGPGPSGVDMVMAAEAVTSLTQPGSVSWPYSDMLDSVRDVTDSSGAVQDHLVYNAVGVLSYQSASSAQALQAFAGAYIDPVTGLQHEGARWYDPITATWISQDPIGFSGGDPNLTRHVGNSATNRIDPTGLQDEDRDSMPVPPSRHPSGESVLYPRDPNAINYEVYERLGGRQPAQAQIDAYNQALLEYYRRVRKEILLIGVELNANGPESLAQLAPACALEPSAITHGTGERATLAIKATASTPRRPFPGNWSEIERVIRYFLENYTKTGFLGVSVGGSLVPGKPTINVPGSPGMAVGKEEFHAATLAAIEVLLHESMHDMRMSGFDIDVGLFPPRFNRHSHIRTVFLTEEAEKNAQTQWGQLVDFLTWAKTCSGGSLWNQVLKRAGPRPSPPAGMSLMK